MRSVLSFIVLFAFWMLLSGKTTPFYLGLGVLSSLFITLWSGDLLFQDKKKSFIDWLEEFGRLLVFSFWLLWEIVLANIHVLKVAFSPDIPSVINPKMVTFKTGVKSDIARFLLANSITLTPGTVTVEVEKGTYLVHALTNEVADGVPGDMAKKVANVFGEKA